MTALEGIRDYAFHLRMYALAEELDWDALKSASHAKLFDAVIANNQRCTITLTELVKATFAPPGDAARTCKDEDGALQQLAVAAVLTHEAKTWQEDARKIFEDSVQGPRYAGFRSAYDTIKRENRDLIEFAGTAKGLVLVRKRVVDQRRDSRPVVGGNDRISWLSSAGPPNMSPTKGKVTKTRFKKEQVPRRPAESPAKAKADGEVDMDVDTE